MGHSSKSFKARNHSDWNLRRYMGTLLPRRGSKNRGYGQMDRRVERFSETDSIQARFVRRLRVEFLVRHESFIQVEERYEC